MEYKPYGQGPLTVFNPEQGIFLDSKVAEYRGFKLMVPDQSPTMFWVVADPPAELANQQWTTLREVQKSIDLYLARQAKHGS